MSLKGAVIYCAYALAVGGSIGGLLYNYNKDRLFVLRDDIQFERAFNSSLAKHGETNGDGFISTSEERDFRAIFLQVIT